MYENTLIWFIILPRNSVDLIRRDFRGAGRKGGLGGGVQGRKKKKKTGRAGKSYKMISRARQFSNGSNSVLLMLHPQDMHQCKGMKRSTQTVKGQFN